MTDISDPHCPYCGRKILINIYRDARWRSAILQDTPVEVWRQYESDGIGLVLAVKMEMSYAR